MINLMMGDCLERMKEIPSGSVDAIICDPPYGTVKGIADGNVSHGMSGKTEWDEALDTGAMFNECNRILRMNGALVLFAQEPYTSHMIGNAHGNLPFSYRMTWLKDHFANAMIAKKAPVSYTEDVCVFFKQLNRHDVNEGNPVRDYAARLFESIGKNKRELFAEMGHQGACHFMRFDSAQFTICTENTYSQLRGLYGIDKQEWFIPYCELRRISDAYTGKELSRLKESHPRVFNLPEGAKFKSNVLQYKKDRDGYHPTQKPVALMADLVRTYTNAGDTVLDFTMGSGSTGVACVREGRNFIGIERDDGYFKIAQDRIEAAAK